MANLNPYKLKAGGNLYAIQPATESKANWEITIFSNGLKPARSLGLFCPTKKSVKATIAKAENVKESEIEEIE